LPGTGQTSSTSANRGIIGVTVTATTSTNGAHVRSVISGSPAAQAGIVQGDVITGVGSDAVKGSETLEADLSGDQAGQTVKISWTTAAGTQKSATITLESAAQG
jgi:S1-C subfamily serine protease